MERARRYEKLRNRRSAMKEELGVMNKKNEGREAGSALKSGLLLS